MRPDYYLGSIVSQPNLILGKRITDNYEFVRLNTGSVNWKVDGVDHIIKPGTILLAHPNHEEEWIWDTETSTHHDYIHFENTLIPDFLPPASHWPTFNHQKSHSILHQLFDHCVKLNYSANVMKESLLKQSIITLLCNFIFETEVYQKPSPFPVELEKVFNFIGEEWSKGYLKPPSIEDLSLVSTLSKAHLIRVFKKECGMTPQKILEALRLHCACYLLNHTNQSISQVSDFLCYETQFHFSKNFKNFIKLSPLKYRQARNDFGVPFIEESPRLMNLFRRVQGKLSHT